MDISSAFADPDGDPLSFSADSSDDAVVAASLSASTLLLSPGTAGTATVSVTADDGRGAQATLSISVTVSSNTSPAIPNPIPDQEVSAGSSSLSFDLSTVFSDADGDALSFSASSSNEDVATTSLSGNVLSITPVTAGTAMITVTATDIFSATAADEFSITVTSTTAMQRLTDEIPTEVMLEAIYPNPFISNTTIRFGLPSATHVLIDIYTVDGRRVALLINNKLPPGAYEIQWSPVELSSGTYLVRLRSHRKMLTRAVTLMH